MRLHRIGFLAAVLAAALFMPTTAQAISFTDGDEICRSGQPPTQDADFLSDCGFTGLTLLYKDDGSEAGSFADDYTTSFTSTSGSITWDGPDSIDCPTCYLVVKDGEPGGWYLFDLNTWNGTDTITLSGLYPDGGAISHLSIWGAEEGGGDGPGEGPVPEPASLALLGMALTAVGMRMRRGHA